MSTMLKDSHSRAQNSSFKKLLFALTGIFGFCFAVFFAANAFFKNGFLYSAAITFGVTFYHFAIRLIIGCITDKVFRERTNPNSKWFSQRSLSTQFIKSLMFTNGKILFRLMTRISLILNIIVLKKSPVQCAPPKYVTS